MTAVDVLTDSSPDGIMWSRVNTGETLPGVLTPMTWSFFGPSLERAVRQGLADLGTIPAEDIPYPDDVRARFFGIFHGRIAVNVDVARRLMSGLPGVNGDDVERDMLGSVRPGIEDDGYTGRLGSVLVKAPLALIAGAREPSRMCADTRRWWAATVGPEGPRPGVDAAALLRESRRRFAEAVRLQGQTRLIFQSSVLGLTKLAERAGEPAAAASLLAAESGTEEAQVADELSRLARSQLTLPEFLSRYGFHGPGSAELSSRSWREDSAALERLLGSVRDAEPPSERRARATADRAQVVARVLGALSPPERMAARAALRIAPKTVRALEHTKTCFLICQDGARAATRGLGAELAEAGRLDDPDDAFHLFADELLAQSGDLRALITGRRALREQCLAVELPETWTGQPDAQAPRAPETHEGITRLEGIGGSPGVVEGTAHVVRDPDEDVELTPGDILVCPTTDPSWLAVMTVAGGLVIDIGAAASHGAIVARELGVPCVIGTRIGTTALRHGARLRVDGNRGVVDVIT